MAGQTDKCEPESVELTISFPQEISEERRDRATLLASRLVSFIARFGEQDDETQERVAIVVSQLMDERFEDLVLCCRYGGSVRVSLDSASPIPESRFGFN